MVAADVGTQTGGHWTVMRGSSQPFRAIYCAQGANGRRRKFRLSVDSRRQSRRRSWPCLLTTSAPQPRAGQGSAPPAEQHPGSTAFKVPTPYPTCDGTTHVFTPKDITMSFELLNPGIVTAFSDSGTALVAVVGVVLVIGDVVGTMLRHRPVPAAPESHYAAPLELLDRSSDRSAALACLRRPHQFRGQPSSDLSRSAPRPRAGAVHRTTSHLMENPMSQPAPPRCYRIAAYAASGDASCSSTPPNTPDRPGHRVHPTGRPFAQILAWPGHRPRLRLGRRRGGTFGLVAYWSTRSHSRALVGVES